MLRRSFLPVLLLVALLPGCGGDDAPDTPKGVLQATFGDSKAIKSGDLRLALDADLKGVTGLDGPLKVGLRGPFQSKGGSELPDFDFDLDLSAAGQTFTAGAVSTGDKGFLQFQGQAFQLSDQQYKQFKDGYQQAQKESGSKSKDGPSFGSLGIKPLDWLRNPQDAGTEKVGGADAQHVTADVDVPRFLTDVSRLLDRAKGIQVQGAGKVPGGLSEQQRQEIAAAVKSTKIDVWSGKSDQTLRRLRLAVTLEVPQASRKAVGGLTSGTIAFDLTIGELNQKQEIQAPSGARPIEELTGAASGATGQGGATGQSGPAADAPQEYLDCVAKAGNDVAALQACADLVNK